MIALEINKSICYSLIMRRPGNLNGLSFFAPKYEKSIVLDSKILYNTKNISAITVEDVLQAAKLHLNY